MFNEALRLRERHVEFNVDALKQAAEASIRNKHGRVVEISKLAEGGFNRVLTLRLEDGHEMIAKIPYHITSPKFYTTASEVATLDFLRLQDIAVPKVHGYSTTSKNAVGSEYILMSKAKGNSLSSRWHLLGKKEIIKATHSFVEYEKKLFDIPFGAIGSIYYKIDLPSELQAPFLSGIGDGADRRLEDFCIGPITDYMFWNGKREGLELSRGPWRDSTAYLRAIADKEILWAEKFGRDRAPDFPYNTMGLGRQSVSSYVELLEEYKRLCPFLLPTTGADPLALPTLRHPDITPANIFVSDETNEVSCLIDWQHSVVQPRALTAGYPPAFADPGSQQIRELKEPVLPSELDSLPLEERVEIQASYRRQAMFHYYRVFNGAFNKSHLAAIKDPLLKLRQHLVDRAGRQWNGNTVTLKGALIRTVQSWNKMTGRSDIPCPLQFDEYDVEQFLKTEKEWLRFSFAVENWREQVCFMNEDGWVANEDYEDAKTKLRDLTALIWANCVGDKEDEDGFRESYPFRDHEEDD